MKLWIAWTFIGEAAATHDRNEWGGWWKWIKLLNSVNWQITFCKFNWNTSRPVACSAVFVECQREVEVHSSFDCQWIGHESRCFHFVVRCNGRHRCCCTQQHLPCMANEHVFWEEKRTQTWQHQNECEWWVRVIAHTLSENTEWNCVSSVKMFSTNDTNARCGKWLTSLPPHNSLSTQRGRKKNGDKWSVCKWK